MLQVVDLHKCIYLTVRSGFQHLIYMKTDPVGHDNVASTSDA